MICRLVPLLTCGLLLSGCGLGDTWFGESDEDPLPGERISIMSLDRTIEQDPSVSELEIKLPPPSVNENWTQVGGAPGHAMSHLALGDPLKIRWRADVGEGSDDDQRLLAQPLVVGNRVFTMDSRSTVTAYDAERGKQVWRVDLETDDERAGFFGGGVAYESDRLFVTTGFAKVFALDAANGEVLWSQRLPAPMRAAPAASGGRVFAVTIDNQVHALAAEDGSRLWRHGGIEEDANLVGGASPAVEGSAVIVPYSSGEIFSLLAENGRVLWSDVLSAVNRVDPIADLAHIRGEPVIDRGLVLAVSHSGRMVAIDLRSGARAWDIDLGGVQMPWVAGDYVYLVTKEAQVVCLTRREGRVRWVASLPRYEDPEDQEDPIQWFGPVLAGGRLILAGSHGEAVSLSPYDGEELGPIELPGAPAVAPVVAGNTLYFLTEGANLVALR
jgi:outer membrane protein assembly factor BamB